MKASVFFSKRIFYLILTSVKFIHTTKTKKNHRRFLFFNFIFFVRWKKKEKKTWM